MVIGADGANSRVAKDIDAGEYDYAIAFQVHWTSKGAGWSAAAGVQGCWWNGGGGPGRGAQARTTPGAHRSGPTPLPPALPLSLFY